MRGWGGWGTAEVGCGDIKKTGAANRPGEVSWVFQSGHSSFLVQAKGWGRFEWTRACLRLIGERLRGVGPIL